jgi:HEAT repeat protein
MPRWKSWVVVRLSFSDVNKLVQAKDVEGLLRLLQETSDSSDEEQLRRRAMVALALGELRARVAVPHLAPLVDPRERRDARLNTAIALCRIGGPESAAALRPALDDEYGRVRLAAIQGASLDDPEALAAIGAMAKSAPWPRVREAAAEALRQADSDR